MDDGTLRDRLWQGFARLQTLLGGEAAGGVVVEEHGIVASLRARGARLADAERRDRRSEATLDRDVLRRAARALRAARRPPLGRLDRRRASTRVTDALQDARHARDLLLARHGRRDRRSCRSTAARPRAPTDLATVGHVNDLAYGNPDAPAGAHARPAPARAAARLRAPSSRRPPRVGRARAAPRRGLRDLVRRHRAARAPAGPRHRRDAARRARRARGRLHDARRCRPPTSARSSTSRSATARCPTCSCGSGAAEPRRAAARVHVRRALTVLLVLLATLAGGYGALATFTQTKELSVGEIRLSVSPGHRGALDVYVPLVDWGARFEAIRLPGAAARRPAHRRPADGHAGRAGRRARRPARCATRRATRSRPT